MRFIYIIGVVLYIIGVGLCIKRGETRKRGPNLALFCIFYIDRNCDVLPIVEYSIETDDGQTLN